MYPLTLCYGTSRIKADRLSISVKCQIGILHTPSSCVLGGVNHTGLWLRTGCVMNAQVSVFERTCFKE